MTKNQALLILNRYLNNPKKIEGVMMMQFDGLTAADAERASGSPVTTLGRATEVLDREWAFIESVMVAGDD